MNISLFDIIHPAERRFYTFRELQLIYTLNFSLDHLSYYSLLAAIPNTWRIMIRQEMADIELDPNNWFIEVLNAISPSRKIYWHLISIHYPFSLATKQTWELDLNISLGDESWWSLFPNFLALVRPTKLRMLQYRILTRSITTNIKRNKWCPDVSPLCTFCHNTAETMSHLFVNCPQVKKIWYCFARFCAYYLNFDVNQFQDIIDERCILLNDYTGPNKDLIVLLIIATKQYIYSTKCLNEMLNFSNCVSKYVDWYHVEKSFMYNTSDAKKIRVFNRKWQQIF